MLVSSNPAEPIVGVLFLATASIAKGTTLHISSDSTCNSASVVSAVCSVGQSVAGVNSSFSTCVFNVGSENFDVDALFALPLPSLDWRSSVGGRLCRHRPLHALLDARGPSWREWSCAPRGCLYNREEGARWGVRCPQCFVRWRNTKWCVFNRPYTVWHDGRCACSQDHFQVHVGTASPRCCLRRRCSPPASMLCS